MIKHYINPVFFGILMGSTYIHAASQAKFTIMPTTPTTVQVAANGTAIVRYQITNQTKITRILIMTPIASISQTTGGVNACANPFMLTPKQSCFLTLQLNGTTLPKAGVHGGPVVCKTKGAGDNSPDAFLCSQASQANSLQISLSTATSLPLVPVGAYRASGASFTPLLATSLDNGSTWIYPTAIYNNAVLPTNYLNGRLHNSSCSAATCVAAGQYRDTNGILRPLLALSKNSSTWTYPAFLYTNLPANFASNGALFSPSCSGATCIASGQFEDADATRFPLLALSKNGGNSWSYPSAIYNSTNLPDNFNGGASLISSSCDGNICIAAGVYSAGDSDRPLLAVSRNAGSSWTYPAAIYSNILLPANFSSGSFTAASCSGNLCLAAGYYNRSTSDTRPLLAVTQNGGSSWSYPNAILTNLPTNTTDASFVNASCSGSVCIAVGSYTDNTEPQAITRPLVVVSRDKGITWKYPSSIYTNLPRNFGGNAFFSGASCSGSLCIASGYYNVSIDSTRPLLAVSRDGGLTWTYPASIYSKLPANFINNASFSYGTYCRGAICFAGGKYSDETGTPRPLLALTQNGGLTWTYPSAINGTGLPGNFMSGGFYFEEDEG